MRIKKCWISLGLVFSLILSLIGLHLSGPTSDTPKITWGEQELSIQKDGDTYWLDFKDLDISDNLTIYIERKF